MTLGRYTRSPRLDLGAQLGTSVTHESIRSGIKNGTIRYKTIIVRGSERLDTIAGSAYGDGRLWWVLAAASDVGWGLQLPPGTVVNIPDINDVTREVG